MKAILMSIQPKWCELIVSGKKTIEVGKTAPKDTPFKVYMYCPFGGFIDKQRTIPKEPLFRETHFDGIKYTTSIDFADKTLQEHKLANGKVISEFVCDEVKEFTFSNYEAEYRVNHIDLSAMCLNHPDLIGYGKGKLLRGFHISELKIYDEPRELSEFRTIKCTNKRGSCSDCKIKPDCIKYLTRPPKLWQYVEEI